MTNLEKYQRLMNEAAGKEPFTEVAVGYDPLDLGWKILFQVEGRYWAAISRYDEIEDASWRNDVVDGAKRALLGN